jgi:HK97 family phage portal protein
VLSWVLNGNAYLIKIRNKTGTGIAELWYAPHWTVEPVSNDPEVFIEHYRYSAGGVQLDLDPSEVVHFRYGLDPHDPRKGLSPLGGLLREIFTDDEAANFAAALLHNCGVPGLIVSPDGSGPAPGPDDVKATKDYLNDNFTGDRRGEPMVMSGPTKVEQFGFSPEQMQVRDLRRLPEERVTAALGLPAIVVGFGAGLERSTFANFAEAREAAYESNMVPTWRLFAEELRHQLLPDFDDQADSREVAFALREVRALQEDRQKEAERVGSLYKSGVITRKEARLDIGQEAADVDDVYVVPIAVTLQPAAEPSGPLELDDEVAKRRRHKRRDGVLAKAADRQGAMVALYPAPHVAEALAQPGGEPPDQLHLTLAYLGDAADIEDEQGLLAVVEGWAAATPPLSGHVSGVGQFTAGPDPVTYASADLPGLPDARQRLVDQLDRAGYPASGEHGFTPHITLAYDELDPEVDNHPLEFDRATVTLAGERQSFPLTGQAAKGLTKALSADQQRQHQALLEAFDRDADRLRAIFATELETALDELGRKAADAYERLAPKALKADDRVEADRVAAALAVEEWKDGTLRARLETQYLRVAGRTVDSINAVLDLGVDLPAPVEKAIVEMGGTRLGLIDISQDTKDAIYRALADAREAGEGPIEAARRIRQYVPAGRFSQAGAKYRAELIARTETKTAQNLSSLAAYRAAGNVASVIAYDARSGRSDADCEDRNGQEFSLDDASGEGLYHPNCTLSWGPVVGGPQSLADDLAG